MLGKGSFATVYKATYKHLDVAVKVINMQPDEDDDESKELRERFAEFRKEVSLMSGLDNPHLMELLGLCIEDDCMLMITEFAAFGDLYNFLQDPEYALLLPQCTEARDLLPHRHIQTSLLRAVFYSLSLSLSSKLTRVHTLAL